MSKTRDISRYRAARGRILQRQIMALAFQLNRPIHILDLGGRAAYWDNLDVRHVEHIVLLNNDRGELPANDNGLFSDRLGDACDLSDYDDQSVDLVHSNSVIEHVGLWDRQRTMAKEARRVGCSGWIQTPAFEFPIEPHHQLPFIHWAGQPLRRSLLLGHPAFWGTSVDDRRACVDRTNLLSLSEYQTLFPDCDIFVERFLGLRKSFSAYWRAIMPNHWDAITLETA